MELNFQLSGATDHISPYKSSKRFNWIVFDIKEKNAQTVVHEDCQACCWCWYCWCWYWCCCCPGCSLLWRGNCSTTSACQRFQVFKKSHSLLSFFHMIQKPSLSLSHLLFKYVSFPELWVFKTGWWCLTGNLTTSTALTTQHTLRLVFFNPIWPKGGTLCPPPGMTYLKKTQSVYESIAGLLQSPRT